MHLLNVTCCDSKDLSKRLYYMIEYFRIISSPAYYFVLLTLLLVFAGIDQYNYYVLELVHKANCPYGPLCRGCLQFIIICNICHPRQLN